MPIRLKSLELQGYKTFANRTAFEFPGLITAIVGPNGSGKSNIADSLRWVLGEQSYSLLRGKKTEDMIFSGSELRPRAGMAAATITFDNQDGWLPIDFSEVAITRRAYRDGSNEYLINGQRVRLKDVTELLAQSGLAERTYTIIGQGLVDAALALKAEDRRKLFEEAAGIGLYRSRRDEAIRRLESTQRNLERVEDILAELEPRLRSLERQARRAQEYEQVKADLHVLLRDWYGYHWHRAQKELMEARHTDKLHRGALEKARRAHLELDEKLGSLRLEIQARRESLNENRKRSADLLLKRESLSRTLAVIDERVRSMDEQLLATQEQAARLDEEDQLQIELNSLAEQEIARLQGETDEARSHLRQAQTSLEKRQDERNLVDTQIQETRQSINSLNTRLGQLQARALEREAQIGRDQKALENVHLGIETTEKEIQAARDRQKKIQDNLRELQTRFVQSSEAIQSQRASIDHELERRKRLGDQITKLEGDWARTKAHIDVLDQAEQTLVGYAEGARQLIQAVNQERLNGKPGPLSQYLSLAAVHEQAISAALGEFLQAVILVDDISNGLDYLDRLGERGALVDAGLIRFGNLITPADFGAAELMNSELGWVGVAAELVQTTAELRPIVNLLLGSVWVVKDRQIAHNLLELLPGYAEGKADDSEGGTMVTGWEDPVGRKFFEAALSGLRVVSLDGELYYSSGAVIGGAVKAETTEEDERTSSSLLSRQRQRRELSEQEEQLRERLLGMRAELVELDQGLSMLNLEMEVREEENRKARQLLEAEKTSIQQAGLDADHAIRQAAWQEEQKLRLSEQIEQAQVDVERYQKEAEQVEEELKTERETLRERAGILAEMTLDEYQLQAAHWNTRLAVLERALDDEMRRFNERLKAIERTAAQRQALIEREDELGRNRTTLMQERLTADAELETIQLEMTVVKEAIEPLESSLFEMETGLKQLEDQETNARQALSLADHQHAQSRIQLAKRQENLDGLRRRIEDDFGLVAFDYAEQISGQTPLPLAGMVEQLPRVVQLAPEIEEAIRRQRAQLRRIGPINPEAQAEYESVHERYLFMREQLDDLREAERDIRQVIQELDDLMTRDFKATYEAVASEFRAIFQRLFEGGSARLILTDPDNPADSGIDIDARLPGRRTQGLSLLSGGERSLTATALVFALLRISPTPFCVLDEVDAMLDEANVGRFRELLRELSEKTQFVIVTHNRNTVQAADTIYGVTMGRDSISQVVSLKLDQIPDVIEA